MEIPRTGVDKETLLERLGELTAGDVDWRSGRTWSLVYHAGDDHHRFLEQVYGMFLSTNGLNPMAFKSLRRLESEVVAMTASMLHGPDGVVGSMTSGGTESILLAVKTYRDLARKQKPWLLRPELVLPRTAHVAFEKACHYFGVRPRFARVGQDWKADVDHMARLVNRRTIALVASAPQYPHGVVDPVRDVAALGLAKGIPVHVDACFGGFVLPWLERLGYQIPAWDFRVPGVTSVSADVHKYGYAAKGASVLLFSSMEYMRHQFFVSTDWPGGVYASATMPGTRPGGAIAAAWASMMAMGEEGYLELARRSMDAAERLRAGIRGIDSLELMGDGQTTIVTFEARDGSGVDVYALADRLDERRWHLDRQQLPPSLHMTVGPGNVGVVDEFLRDLEETVREVLAHPEWAGQGAAAMYGMMAKVPMRFMVKHGVSKVMEAMYSAGGEEPDLAALGEGGRDDRLFRIMRKHGDKALQALARVDEQVARMKRLLPKGRIHLPW